MQLGRCTISRSEELVQFSLDNPALLEAQNRSLSNEQGRSGNSGSGGNSESAQNYLNPLFGLRNLTAQASQFSPPNFLNGQMILVKTIYSNED